MPAVATVFPDSCHQFCQVHYLRHLAELLAAADAACKGDRRQAVRTQVGDRLRQEPHRRPGHAGVLAVTGLLPSPVEAPATPGSPSSASAVAPPAATPAADEVLTQLVCHTRSWLTLKGRPPFRLAGLETYERLHSVAGLRLNLLATRYDPRLAHLLQGLQAALAPLAETYRTLQQDTAWLRNIAYILEPMPTFPLRAADIAGQLRCYLNTVQRQPALPPALETFRRHLDTVRRSYEPGLFHGYEVPGLPRTNNALESHFRETRRRLQQITGQQGQTQRTLQRQGAWELLPHPSTEAALQKTLCHIPSEDLAQARQRFAAHRQRFRLQHRSRRQIQAQFEHLRQQWSILQPTGTG